MSCSLSRVPPTYGFHTKRAKMGYLRSIYTLYFLGSEIDKMSAMTERTPPATGTAQGGVAGVLSHYHLDRFFFLLKIDFNPSFATRLP